MGDSCLSPSLSLSRIAQLTKGGEHSLDQVLDYLIPPQNYTKKQTNYLVSHFPSLSSAELISEHM